MSPCCVMSRLCGEACVSVPVVRVGGEAKGPPDSRWRCIVTTQHHLCAISPYPRAMTAMSTVSIIPESLRPGEKFQAFPLSAKDRRARMGPNVPTSIAVYRIELPASPRQKDPGCLIDVERCRMSLSVPSPSTMRLLSTSLSPSP